MSEQYCDLVTKKCIGFRKFKLSHFVDWCLPELFGTYLFTLFGSAASGVASGVGLNGAFDNGMALAAVLWMVGREKSGGKLNPAVSLMVYLTQNYGAPKSLVKEYASAFLAFILEIGSQIAGGIAAGATLKYLLPDSRTGCFVPTGTNGVTFWWEFLGAFLLIGVIRSIGAESEVDTSTYKANGPLIIGLTLFAGAQAAGPFTGGAFNPARYLANVGFGCTLDKTLYYVGAHIVAALSVTLIAKLQTGLKNSRIARQHVLEVEAETRQKVEERKKLLKDEDDEEHARRERSRYPAPSVPAKALPPIPPRIGRVYSSYE